MWGSCLAIVTACLFSSPPSAAAAAMCRPMPALMHACTVTYPAPPFLFLLTRLSPCPGPLCRRSGPDWTSSDPSDPGLRYCCLCGAAGTGSTDQLVMCSACELCGFCSG
jgi:hypothetical protein